jgi:DNA-directed RNA polymerase subunit RPC12/RpoP
MDPKQQMKLNIDIKKTTGVVCDECGHDVFNQGILLRKVSRFLSGDAQDGIMPIGTFYCAKCGHANAEFYPPELKSEDEQ